MATEGENNKSQSGFTDGETNLLICMLKHLQGDIQSDFDAVAVEMGYKNASIAKTRWNQIRRKKIANGGAVGKVSPIKKRGTANEKSNKHGDDDNGDEHDDEVMVTPKKRKHAAKATPKKEEGSGSEDGCKEEVGSDGDD